MPDPVPAPQSEIDRFIAENGVTRCPDAQWTPPPNVEQARAIRRQLDEMEARGELTKGGIGGVHWREGRAVEYRRHLARRMKARHQERRARYTALAERGATFEEVCEEMGVCARTVESAAWRYGLNFRRSGPAYGASKAEIAALHARGLTNGEIARQIGKSPNTVSTTLRRMGLWAHVKRGRDAP